MSTSTTTRPNGGRSSHAALLYRSDAEFLEHAIGFLEAALADGTPALAALPRPRLDLLRGEWRAADDRIRWVDMADAGRKPGRILPGVLIAFADEHAGRRVAMIGEPIWADRSDGEYVAALQHEALINLAFADRDATILCPYDVHRLARAWLADAERTHPAVIDAGATRDSTCYGDPDSVAREAVAELPEPPARAATTLIADAGDLAGVRAFATTHGRRLGLSGDRALDLQTVANELAATSLVHGNGPGVLSIWRDRDDLGRDAVVVEMYDRGQIADPLVGRRPARLGDGDDDLGLLMVHGLADLVHLRSDATGTTVQAHLAVDPSALPARSGV